MVHACVAMFETHGRNDPHAHGKRGHGTLAICTIQKTRQAISMMENAPP